MSESIARTIGAFVVAIVLSALFFWAWRRHIITPMQLAKGLLAGPRAVWHWLASKPPVFALILLFMIAYAFQSALESGSLLLQQARWLFFMLFPVAGLFVYLEDRSSCGDPSPLHTPIRLSDSTFTWAQLANHPARTFLGTLAVVAIIICADLPSKAENNVAAAALLLVALICFLAACFPSHWRSLLAQWRESIWRDRRAVSLGVVLVLAGAFTRIYALDRFPIGMENDEASLAMDAVGLMRDGNVYLFSVTSFADHPAVFGYLQAVSMTLFGQSEVALRLPSAVFGALTIALACLLMRSAFNWSAALLATIVFGFGHYHLYYSRTGTYDMTAVLLPLTAMIHFLMSGLRSRLVWHYALAGVSLGIGLWFVYNNLSMILIPIALTILAYLALTQSNYLRVEYPKVAIFLAGAVLVMAPVWRTFAREGRLLTEPSRGKFILSEPHLQDALAQYGVSTALEVIAMQVESSVLGMNYLGDNSHLEVGGRRPVLDSLTAVFFFVGLAYSAWRWRSPNYAIMVLWWAVGLQVSIWSPGPPQAHRIAPAVAPAYLLAAIGMHKVGSTWMRLWRWPVRYVGVIATLLLGIIVYKNVSIYFSPEDYPTVWQMAVAAGRIFKEYNPGYDIYYFGSPNFYTTTNATRFYSLDESLSGIDADELTNVVPLRERPRRDVMFLFTYDHFSKLDTVAAYYPGGTVREWTALSQQVLLRGYFVPNSIILDNHYPRGTRNIQQPPRLALADWLIGATTRR